MGVKLLWDSRDGFVSCILLHFYAYTKQWGKHNQTSPDGVGSKMVIK